MGVADTAVHHGDADGDHDEPYAEGGGRQRQPGLDGE
jgi:hypothetical protein